MQTEEELGNYLLHKNSRVIQKENRVVKQLAQQWKYHLHIHQNCDINTIRKQKERKETKRELNPHLS